jgi:hypothetical protein
MLDSGKSSPPETAGMATRIHWVAKAEFGHGYGKWLIKDQLFALLYLQSGFRQNVEHHRMTSDRFQAVQPKA